MLERPVQSLSVESVTLEYKGDPDLHMYRHDDIDDVEVLHVFPLCQDVEFHPLPHAREDLIPFHRHAMSFCAGCWRVMEASESMRIAGT